MKPGDELKMEFKKRMTEEGLEHLNRKKLHRKFFKDTKDVADEKPFFS